MFGKRCRLPPPRRTPAHAEGPWPSAPPAGRRGDRQQVGTPRRPTRRGAVARLPPVTAASPGRRVAPGAGPQARPVIVVEVPRETWTDTAALPAAPQPRPPLDTGAVSCRPAPSVDGAGSPGCSTSLAEPRPPRPLEAGRLPPLLSTPSARDCKKSGTILRPRSPRRGGLRPLGRVPSSGPRPLAAATDRAQAAATRVDPGVPRRRQPSLPRPLRPTSVSR